MSMSCISIHMYIYTHTLYILTLRDTFLIHDSSSAGFVLGSALMLSQQSWCRIFVRIPRETSVILAAQRACHATHEMPALNVRTQLFQEITRFRITPPKCNFNMVNDDLPSSFGKLLRYTMQDVVLQCTMFTA